MRTLTWDQVASRRLARSQLCERAPAERLLQVVSSVCGVQAQIMGAAEFAVAARVDGLSRLDVHGELWERRRLVKAWSIRGTLHLHPADELPLWMAALRVEPYWRRPGWLELYGLTEDEAEAVLQAIGEALDGRCLTRQELGKEVVRRVGQWARRTTKVIQFGKEAETWPQLLSAAAQTGRLVHGPSAGTRTTFVRADQWLERWLELDPREALAEVFRRYLATYGPATESQFARWLGIEPHPVRQVAESLAGELVEVSVEGSRALLPAADVGTPGGGEPESVRLLPKYDCYILGSRLGRGRVVSEEANARLRAHPRGRYEGAVGHSLLLVDGIVAGMWDRKGRGKQVEVRVEPFRRLTSSERAQLELETARIGRFLGANADLSIGKLP